MGDVTKYRKAVVERVLDGDGVSTTEQRHAAFANTGVVEPARALVDKVANQAWRIADEDVAAAKQKLREDEIFELCVCAALGKATRQLEAALAALDEATKET